MTKLNTDNENSVGQASSTTTSEEIIKSNNKFHRTITIAKKPKKNFLAINKSAVSSSSSSTKSRRLSLNTNEILKFASKTTTTINNRRKSLSNPFQLSSSNECEKQLKKFKSKIDYLKVETLTSYDKDLRKIKIDYDNKKTVSSKIIINKKVRSEQDLNLRGRTHLITTPKS